MAFYNQLISRILLICLLTGCCKAQDQESPSTPCNITQEPEYERKCKSFLLDYEKECSKQNETYGNVTCQNCMFNDEKYLMCYSTSKIYVNEILTSVPLLTERLIILYDNTWFGRFPLHPGAIDLTGIGNFINLTYFEIVTEYHQFFQLYPLLAPKEDFVKLEHLKNLAIRIPITTENSNSLFNISTSLNNASVLDLSYTRGIELAHIEEVFQSHNLQTLNRMCLRQFQTPGHLGYNNWFYVFKKMINNNITLDNLYELDLSNNMLTNVAPGISIVFPQLKLIDLSGNLLVDPYNFGILVESIMHSYVQIVNYEDQGFKYYNKGPQLPHLKQHFSLALKPQESNSWHQDTENQVFRLLVNCINLICHGNVSRVKTIASFYCDFVQCLQGNEMRELSCKNLCMPYKPASDCIAFTSIPLGKNLRQLYLGNLHYEEASITGVRLGSGNVCFQENILQVFLFNDNSKWIYAAKFEKLVNGIRNIMGIQKLQIASLSGNNLRVTLQTNNSVYATTNITSLQRLDISENNVAFPEDLHLCKALPKLSYISMNRTSMEYIPPFLFFNCTHLVEISFKYNKLNATSLENLNFTGTNKLSNIILSHNKITIIRKKFQKIVEEGKANNLTVDLSYNPLSCECDNRQFITWLYSKRDQFLGFNNYLCNHSQGNVLVHDIFKFKGFWDDCDHWKTLEVIGITFVCTVTLILALLFFIKNKWRMRYRVFQVREKFRHCCQTKSNPPQTIWQYDAFISYCSTDRFWVHSVLMKSLEEKYGFNLCIHYRDFIAGDAIPNNIAHKMSSSREIIIVLSEEATKSDWCQFELDQALAESSKRKQPLIIIKLGSINNAALVDPKISQLLDTYTYLEWNVDMKKQKVFWSTLVGRLYKDDGCCECCCVTGPRAIGYKDLDIVNNDEEDNQEVLASLPESAKEFWAQAQAAKSQADLAVRYQATLTDVLKNEEVPHWAYGPLPKPVEELLREHTNEINEQIYEYANNKLIFLIKCLHECTEKQIQVYKAKMREVERERQQIHNNIIV